MEVVASRAAVLLGDRQPEQPELAHLLHDVIGEGLVGVVGRALRGHDLLGEVPNEVDQVLVLLIEFQIKHGALFPLGLRIQLHGVPAPDDGPCRPEAGITWPLKPKASMVNIY